MKLIECFYKESNAHSRCIRALLSLFLFLSFMSRSANERSLDWQIIEKCELSVSLSFFLRGTFVPCCQIAALAALRIGHSYFVTATAMSYTGSLLSRKRYLPMSVRAAAESIASLPTRFLSKYGVASRPWIQYNFIYIRGGYRQLQLSTCRSFHLRSSFFFLLAQLQSSINEI